MTQLEGQHAFITGGGSGIGLACAQAFAADGAAVTLVGRREDRLQRAIEHIRGQASYVIADVASEDAVANAVKLAEDKAPITIGVANAGTGKVTPLFETSAADWQHVLDTNLSGTFYTFKHVGAAIARANGGALCAISSIAGLRTHRWMSAYCSSKAAIDMLVRNSADELGALNIRVNSVCPGLVETELSAGLHENTAMRDDYLACMPVNRVGVVADIGRAVRFLCGPEASWITGVSLPVDGGHHLRRGPDLSVMA